MGKNKKGVVLLSGGIDSAVVLFLARRDKYAVKALTFEYGQRHRKELEAAAKLANFLKVKQCCLKIALPWSNSSLIGDKEKIPETRRKGIPSTYVPGRNIIFLSYAFSYAESIGAKKIFIGAHTLDYSGYPDCRENFLKSLNKAFSLGVAKNSIEISYPLIDKDKKEIIKLGFELGVPFERTWSCYQGKEKPCLSCDSCYFRTKAFSDLGLEDPLLEKKCLKQK